MKNTKILIVEDEVVTLDELEEVLIDEGYDVATARTPSEAIKQVNRFKPNVLLMDINLDSDLDGIDLVKSTNKDNSMTVIYMTAYPERFVDTNNTHHAFLPKPVNFDGLSAVVQTAINLHQQVSSTSQITKPQVVKIYRSNVSQHVYDIVNINNITFIMKAGNDKIRIYTYDGNSYEKTSNLKRFLNEIDSNNFIQIERGIAISRNAPIARYEKKPFNLILKWNGREERLPIGKSYIKTVEVFLS